MRPANATISPEIRYEIIDGKPGIKAGDDGSIWSLWTKGSNPRMTETWRRVEPTPLKSGHLRVSLGPYGVEYVHRLILEAFVGPCPEGMEACHDPDRDPANNRRSNLRWDTRKENHADSVRHGTAYFGSDRQPRAPRQLSEESARAVWETRKATGLGEKAIRARLGIPQEFGREVCRILYGLDWNELTGLPKHEAQSGKRGRRPKFPPEVIRSIAAASRDGMSNVDISVLTGVRRALVAAITRGERWNEITGIPKYEVGTLGVGRKAAKGGVSHQ